MSDQHALPKIIVAMPHKTGRKAVVVFEGGAGVVVDLAHAFAERRIYAHLLESRPLFCGLKVAPLGNALAWPDGTEFSAVWLARLPAEALTKDEVQHTLATYVSSSASARDGVDVGAENAPAV